MDTRDDGALDDAVHDLASEIASSINNEGPEAQRAFLDGGEFPLTGLDGAVKAAEAALDLDHYEGSDDEDAGALWEATAALVAAVKDEASTSDSLVDAFARGLAEADGETGVTYDDDPESPRSLAYDYGRTLGRADVESPTWCGVGVTGEGAADVAAGNLAPLGWRARLTYTSDLIADAAVVVADLSLRSGYPVLLVRGLNRFGDPEGESFGVPFESLASIHFY